MRVLVTGATGVYGRSVVERLHRAGHEVVAMARRPPKALPAGVRFVAADVRDLPTVTKAMEGCEVVAHLAFVVTPMKDREQSRAISVGGTQNIVDAMQRTGARRLVFASSAMTYGANADNPPLFTRSRARRARPGHQAERVALALGQTLAALVRERAVRLVTAGALKDVDDAAHLTWDELLAPPPDLSAVVGRRRAEHARLAELPIPSIISVVGADSAIARP